MVLYYWTRMDHHSPRFLPYVVCRLLLVLVSTHITEVAPQVAQPRVAAVAEPNLGALLGLGGPLTSGNPGALLQGLGGHGIGGIGGANAHSPANLQALRDSGALDNICNTNSNNNNGNSDALTNLLVYQYLSGSIPGSAGTHPGANVAAARAVAAVGNPQLQALLEGTMESKTKTSVTTTLTIRTITMDPSTKFTTSTTSYVTTITSLTSSVLPIIFRGSKITTTITDKQTEVLTATEFITSSSVLTPSIIQTLNVEVTLTETSTKGLNGLFTLAQVTPGASKIIEQPISSTNIDFDTQGLDLSSIDLATLDLAGLRGSGNGDNSQVVKALTALLKQYNDEPEEPRGRGRERDRDQRNFGNTRNTRFHTRSRFSPNNEDPPKFNVIRGFTLSDRPPSRNANTNTDSSSGTAIENTRYSKFRKKNSVQNNSLGSTEPDRESERFSASTSRRTVSRAGERRRDTRPQGRSRFPSDAKFSARSSEGRTDRQIERSRRGSEKDLKSNITPEPNEIRVINDKMTIFTTTLLTMHISGVRPGEIITTVRTVTLRGIQSERSKREILASLPLPQPITNTALPDLTSALHSKEVVRLLKDLDKSAVRKMLHSLHDWVNYYLHQVLDETVEPSFYSKGGFANNEITDLHSSKVEEESSLPQDATASLTSLPNAITRTPPVVTASEINSCPTVSVKTETVYKTIIVSKPR